MISRNTFRVQTKLVFIAFLIFAGLIVYAKTTKKKVEGPFALAEEVPRGALVFAQFHDLPGFIERWNESSLKEKYLQSANYQQFLRRHLALKLAERLNEFNDELGFPLDAATVTSAGTGAALAVYDIGRLDVLFIARLSAEQSAASLFIQNKENFEEKESPDGITFYSREVEADRGRQKQHIAFAVLANRFVLATDEALLLRTVANLKNRAHRDALADDPSFSSLAGVTTPHDVTVWVDQAKLNNDWYFKRYWVMKNMEELKSLRAGIFDLEMGTTQEAGQWVERRDFLYAKDSARHDGVTPRPSLSASELNRATLSIPDDAPYYKVSEVRDDAAGAARLIRDTLFDRFDESSAQTKPNWHWQSYGGGDFSAEETNDSWSAGGGSSRYAYLGYEYDATIDDPHDARVKGREEESDGELRANLERDSLHALQQTLQPAYPSWAIAAESPQALAGGPLFVEFRRAAVFSLRAPAALDRIGLEGAMLRAAQNRLLVAAPTQPTNLAWTTNKNESGDEWRRLDFPMLGWGLSYTQMGNELIFSNSPEFLTGIMARLRAAGSKGTPASADSQVDDLTVIRFDRRKQVFDDVMEKIDAREIGEGEERRESDQGENESAASHAFFSGNIASLLNVAARVNRVEIKRQKLPHRLHEEIAVFFD